MKSQTFKTDGGTLPFSEKFMPHESISFKGTDPRPHARHRGWFGTQHLGADPGQQRQGQSSSTGYKFMELLGVLDGWEESIL